MSLNFDLSEEHRIFWDTIASFVDKEIAPLVDEAEAKEEFPVNQFKIAEWAMYIDIMHTITWKAAWMYDQGRDCTREASMVKLFCSETTQNIINQAIQLFGGYGFMMEYPIQRFWRDSRVLTITEGVPEIHRGIIYRSLDGG